MRSNNIPMKQSRHQIYRQRKQAQHTLEIDHLNEALAAAKEEARKAKADAAATIPVLDKAAALLPRVSAYIDDLERRHRRRGIIILATTAAAIIASAAAALLAMQLTAQRSPWSAPSVQPPASTRLTVVTDGYVDLAGHWRSFDNGHEIEVNAWRQPHAQ